MLFLISRTSPTCMYSEKCPIVLNPTLLPSPPRVLIVGKASELTYSCVRLLPLTQVKSQSVTAMLQRYGSGSGDRRNRKHRKGACVIPFFTLPHRYDARRRCGLSLPL